MFTLTHDVLVDTLIEQYGLSLGSKFPVTHFFGFYARLSALITPDST